MFGTAFRDRADAGRALATHLSGYSDAGDVIVLGLPRGGVPVAAEVAAAIRAPLDVFVVRKLGVPGHPELAMGAIAAGGVRVLNSSVVQALGIQREAIDQVAAEEAKELDRRVHAYRGDRPPLSLAGRVVIVADDGLATGATMRAAVAAIRAQAPARVVVAVPVGARQTCEELREQADEVVCAKTPAMFQAVGQWYQDFSPTQDAEIAALLATGREAPSA